MIKVNFKIGQQTIQAEFNTMKELHQHNSVYANLPKVCDACKNEDIYLNYREIKGHEYWSLSCSKCGASGNFGIHKNNEKSIFWKREKMEKYQGNNDQQPTTVKDDKDLPF